MLINYDNILPIARIMNTEKSKTRSKNFTQEEIMSLVDLIHDQKSKLFGALTSTLTFDDKNKIWEEISGRLSELHGNVRTRDDIMKIWYNTLTKHKPRIADKLASARKTGGGHADADLNEIEAQPVASKGRKLLKALNRVPISLLNPNVQMMKLKGC